MKSYRISVMMLVQKNQILYMYLSYFEVFQKSYYKKGRTVSEVAKSVRNDHFFQIFSN